MEIAEIRRKTEMNIVQITKVACVYHMPRESMCTVLSSHIGSKQIANKLDLADINLTV